MSDELRAELEEFCPVKPGESDIEWQERAAKRIKFLDSFRTTDFDGGGLPFGCGNILDWARAR